MRSIFTVVVLLFCRIAFSQGTFVDNHLVIKFTDRAYAGLKIDFENRHLGSGQIDGLNQQYAINLIRPIGQTQKTKTFLLEFTNPVDVKKAVLQYAQTGLLAYVEPDYLVSGAGVKGVEIIPNDTRFDRQWGMFNNGSMSGIGNVTADADVDIDLAWDIQTGDPDMIIAVPDSGLRMVHPDIAARIWVNSDEIAGNGMDDDNNGFIDDTSGWDFVNSDNNPTDDHGHGTNVAGIIGSIANNNLLYTGANWNSKIMPIKVLNSSNGGSYADMAASVYYAVDNGAKIISMSIGGSSDTVLMADAMAYSNENNVLFLACMMNFDNDVVYYPAGYSLAFPNVIAVGSTNPDDTRTSPFFWSATSGSNFGSHLNVVAPGNFIYGLDAFSNTNANTYWGGTSQATPLVAGIASLIWAQNPALTAPEIRSILEATAEDEVGDASEDAPGFDEFMGYGRVNAFAALQTLGSNQPMQQQEFCIVNPIVDGSLHVFCKGQHEGIYRLTVNNMDGKLLMSQDIDINQGVNVIPFSRAYGSYIVTLANKEYSKVFKVLKD
jgi:thermitase